MPFYRSATKYTKSGKNNKLQRGEEFGMLQTIDDTSWHYLFFDLKNCISSVKTAIRKEKWKNVGMGMNHFTRSCRRHTLFLLYAPLPCAEDLCVQPHVRPTRGSALDRKNRYLCEKNTIVFPFIFECSKCTRPSSRLSWNDFCYVRRVEHKNCQKNYLKCVGHGKQTVFEIIGKTHTMMSATGK